MKQSLLARRGLFVALSVLALGAVAANLTWRTYQAQLRQTPEYRVTAASIAITPQPMWVRSDVKTEALHQSGLLQATGGEGMSILDSPQRLEERLATALGFHPWVARVGTIQRFPPNRVVVEVEYRRPIAAVQSRGALTPIDAELVVLPPQDLDPQDLRRLPRVQLGGAMHDVASLRSGQTWSSPAIQGAVALVSKLGPLWGSLHLLDVTPSASPEVRGDQRYYVYELRTKGGTHIHWGAAPELGPVDESSFDEKLSRLNTFIAQNGPLESVTTSPKRIDIRDGVRIEPRIAQEPDDTTGTKTAQAPDDEVLK